jgi:cytochrome d ubiquinol oxidase subunit I
MNAETLDLARLQFAITAGSHFLFVALTLGLAAILVLVQTRATVTGDDVYERMTRFWGQLYIINYGMGLVTGLFMEFQFGLNWSGLIKTAGDVFGAPMAMEALVAFFIESTFLGLWIFGWGRLNKWVHLALIWVVALTAYASAYWILIANGFLQNPVGQEWRDGALRLVDTAALFSNPDALVALAHVVGAGLLAASFFVAGISAYHLRKGTTDLDFFRRSLRIGLFTAGPAALFTVIVGFGQFGVVGDSVPMKLAVSRGDTAEQARLQAEMVARFGPGDYRPPSWISGVASTMLMIGMLLLIVALATLPLAFRSRFGRGARLGLRLLTWAIALPFIATLAGWMFREVGRQPWTITEILRTRDALSPTASTGTLWSALIVFTALFAALIILDSWLLARYARRGPEGALLGMPPDPRQEPEPVPTF